MITGLHHTALSVRELDAAIGFFTSEQAFSLRTRFALADTAANRAMLQIGDATARGALMQGSLGCLALFEFAGTPDAASGTVSLQPKNAGPPRWSNPPFGSNS